MSRASVINELEMLSARFDGEIRHDELTRKVYSTDASVYQETPVAVAFPKSDDDLRGLIDVAQKVGVGLLPRTAGTSLAGQVVGAGIVVDIGRHFTEILEINAEEKWVRVQPGVIRNELNTALHSHGLLFGPETATANRAMIGGMLGNNSCGANSIVYGSIRDHVIEVTGYLSDGSKVTFGKVTDQELAKLGSQTNLEGSIYRNIKQLFSDPEVRAEIKAQFPKANVTRRNTGYALDAIAQSFDDSDEPLNLSQLIAGSEGTLLLATEIKLRCHDLPPPVSCLLCPHFESIDAALRATLIAMRHKPFACELIDQLVLQGASRNIEQQKNMDWVKDQPAAVLVIDVRGQTLEATNAQAVRIRDECIAAGLGFHFPILTAPESEKVWALRKAGLGVVANVVGDAKPTTVIEDTAVALEDLPAYIAEFNELLKSKYGFDCVHYAHAGAGEIHLRPVLNLKTENGQREFREIATDVAALVKKWGGSLSGEHGDGRLRAEFLPTMIGAKNYAICREIKKLFDPYNIFNPGKIVNAPAMDTHLRYKVNQLPDKTKTILSFDSTEGFLGAAEMCSGSGDCRKTHLTGGTMCPSYMATRNEIDSTRARANVLRQVLTQPENSIQPLNHKGIKQVLDLCLSCKACKSECPSNVDMAKMKAEFLQAYQDANGVPFRSKIIAGYSTLNRIASLMPGLYNFLSQNPITSNLLKRIVGFHSRRSLPRLHRQTLRGWFKSHSKHAKAGTVGAVYLFCDEFTNFNDVEVGIATVELLETLGYSVELVEHEESGRAAISKGLLRQAKKFAEKNVATFFSIVSANKPLIGIEPSALLTFRDEYPLLLRDQMAAKAERLASHCKLVDEFISDELLANRISPKQFTSESKLIRLHGHCHQKAIASLAPTVRMLSLPANYKVRLIPSGCCGMAGSFGYEREHYEVSNQIGELVLMPTIRAEPAETIIAAAGTSCRHQIADSTDRVAFHPAQIIRNALCD